MRRQIILLFFLLLIISSCSNIRPEGGDSFVTVTVGSNAQTAKVKVQKATLFARIRMFLKGIMPDTAIAAIPSTVNKINFTIEGSDMEAITRSVDVSGQSEITEDFMVSNGAGRVFTVDAVNPSGTVLYTGSATADLNGLPVTLTIDMVLRPWARSFGGAGYDVIYSIQQTSDGGYIAGGGTDSFGAGVYDMWVLKLNADGTAAWQKTYGGTSYEWVYSIQQTSDGGYIVSGYTNSFGAGSSDLWVLKLNSDGTVAWQKTYGGSGQDWGYIQQTSDGGYIVSGYTNSFGAGGYDFWVLKLNADGTAAWQKTYGGSGNDWPYSIQQTTDGGYIAAGGATSFGAGSYDFWVLKLNSDGTVAWQKTYGGSGEDFAYSIQQTSDGGYIVAGYTASFGAGGNDMWVLKLNADGTAAWQKVYGGTGNDSSNFIQQTTDAGYIVAGTTNSFSAGGDDDMWVLKLNADGTAAWQKVYGGTGYDVVYSIQQITDGGYIAAGGGASFGEGDYDSWVLKLASDGTIDFNASSGAGATNTNATITNTSVTGADTTIIGADTNVSPIDSNATVADTNAGVRQQAP